MPTTTTPSRSSRARHCSWLVLALLGTGCTGRIEDEVLAVHSQGGAGQAGSGVIGGGAGAAGMTAAPEPCGTRLPRRLVILSDLQHSNAIVTLLGDEALAGEQRPDAETKTFSQKGVVVNTSLVHQRMSLAEKAAASVRERFKSVTGCEENGDQACARTFIERFAKRAFRRPVASEELDDLMLVYQVGAEQDFITGVTSMVEAALGSPSFLYRRELGTEGSGDSVALTPHELASELSFLLTDDAPDDELLAAADSGMLADASERARQLERLLKTPQVQQSLVTTLMAAWNLGNLFGTVKDPGLYPEYTPALQASMFHETELFLDDVLWQRRAPIAELLSSRNTFVNPALAKLYGIAYPAASGDDFLPVTLPPERAGLLTQPSVLATLARTDNTSVVARGLFVRGALLCLPKVNSPPASLTGEIQKLLAADMTERERAEVRGTTSPCNSCHAQFDAFGLLLERYDALGKYRTTLDGEPIDPSADVDRIGSFDRKFGDAIEFAQAAAMAPEMTACITRHVLAYATTDDALLTSDCQVEEVVASLPSSGASLPEIVNAVASSLAFTQRSTESKP